MDTPIGPRLAKMPVAGKMIMPSVESNGKNHSTTLIKKEKRYPEKETENSVRSFISVTSALSIGYKQSPMTDAYQRLLAQPCK